MRALAFMGVVVVSLMVGIGLLTAVDDANAEERVAQESRRSMATTDVERVLEDWATDWSSHDTEKLLALFTDDCIYEDVPLGVAKHGKAELRAFANDVFARVPDFKIELTARFAADTWASMEWVMSGTHQPTGKRFSSIRGATILELERGKIRHNSDYWDAATRMRQLGLLPAQ
jgi:steroid delta-isomerase-like uncharacterized protein